MVAQLEYILLKPVATKFFQKIPPYITSDESCNMFEVFNINAAPKTLHISLVYLSKNCHHHRFWTLLALNYFLV